MRIHLFEAHDMAVSCRRGVTPPDDWKTTENEARVTCGRCKRIIDARSGTPYHAALWPFNGRK